MLQKDPNQPQSARMEDETQFFYQIVNDDDQYHIVDVKKIEEHYDPLLQDLKEESYNIYILLRSMSFTSTIFQEKMKKSKRLLQ